MKPGQYDNPNPENQHNTAPTKTTKLPGGAVPEHLLWQSRVDQSTGKETGVRSPDGTYNELHEGEHFEIRKEGKDYEAVIVGADGKERILKESASRRHAHQQEQDKTELANVRRQLGLTSEVGGSLESKESRELKERISVAAEYLSRLDTFAESITIDSATGIINYTKPDLGETQNADVKEHQKNFTELIQQFNDKNEQYLKKLKTAPGIIDAQVVMGAIVATYDSSKKVPDIFQGKVSSNRGEYHEASVEPGESYLGFIPVDINKQKRQDNIEPTTTAVHELHHHALAVSDYLTTKDPNLNLQSGYRKGRTTALFGSGSGRIPTEQAFINDRDKYSKMLGRESDPQTFRAQELPRIQSQLSYLDELHSSYLQKKDNWFNAQENVYSTKGKGKHWELVGDHPEDIQASKNVLGYIQGFYSLELLRSAWEQRINSGQPVGEGQKRFIAEFSNEFRKVGSLLGAARTIKQAESLVADEWSKFRVNNQRLFTSPELTAILNGWQNGSGVENLDRILTV